VSEPDDTITGGHADAPKIATDRHGYVRVRGMSLVLLLLLVIAIATSVAAIELVQIKCGIGVRCGQTSTSSEP
jgi:hypothetical protein